MDSIRGAFFLVGGTGFYRFFQIIPMVLVPFHCLSA